MIKNFEWIIARRYLKPKRKEGIVSLIAAFSFFGIMLGVATLIVVMAVMNGFREELMNKILGFNGHISIYNNQGPWTDPMIDQMKSLSNIKTLNFFIEQQALVMKGGAMAGVQIRAVNEDTFQSHPHLKGKIQKVVNPSGQDQVFLGGRLAHKLNVALGQSVTILLPQGNATAFGRLPRTKKFFIAGIFNIGMSVYDEAFIFMPLKTGEIFLNCSTKNIEIFLNKPSEMTATIASLQQILPAGPATQIIDWQQSNSHFFNAIKIERNVMFLILTLIIVVAAFNIISSMIMMVKDKTTSIAILRTMGASKQSILTIFFLTGASIGCAGTLAGVMVGLGFASHIEEIRRWLEQLSQCNLFSAEIYFLSQLPAIVKLEDVLMVTGMALLLSLLATLYPSWKATLIDPAETLRYG